MIKATITADGTNATHTWDAISWFEQAMDVEIERLQAANWKDSWEATEVAWWFQGNGDTPDGRRIDDVLNQADGGWVVHIDQTDAESWFAKRAS
jgi:hypothetical protein